MVPAEIPGEPSMLRAPPNSTEAEQALIGGLLVSNDAYDQVPALVADDFYSGQHRLIWPVLRGMLEAGRPVDIVTLGNELKTKGDLDKVGGVVYLASLEQSAPGALNVRQYAELVRSKAVLRRLMLAAQELQEACATGAEDPHALAERAEQMILAVSGEQVDAEEDLPALLMRIVDRADDARKEGRPSGLRTGFGMLDERLGGLTPGSLTILAARPSVGKTALALNIADQVAARQSVAFFSLEQSRDELGARLLASAAGVPLDAIPSGRLDERQVNAMADAAILGRERMLQIDDRGGIGLGYIRARCRRLKRKHGLGLVVVDYLQLMSGAGSSREQEVSSISRGLKALAKELRVPVLALCQLNRSLEGRTDKRPQLYDLRESGAIEQDADIVLMLYRDEVNGEQGPNHGLCQVLIRKNRNGPLGAVTLRYTPELCRFESTEERFEYGAVTSLRPVRGFRAGGQEIDWKSRSAGEDGR